MYNTLTQMPNNIYRAAIYIRLSEADEGKSYESESESIINQRNLLMNYIKEQIRNTISEFYNNFEKKNVNLESDRSYEEIMNDLMNIESFTEKYPYKYYKEIRYKEGSISHCGYPDYMWQSGAERNIYTFS